MLKAVLSDLDNVEENIKTLYKQQENGTYLLQVEGMSPKSKIDEFRNSNIKLNKELAEARNDMTRFKDIDPKKYKEYKQKVLDLQDKELIDAGKLEEVVGQRTERMRTDFETKTANLQKVAQESVSKYDTVKKQLDDFMLTGELTKVASAAKIRSSAITDVINRGKTIFKLKDGKITPYESDGAVMYGNDGISEMTTKEWMEGLGKSAPHLFEDSRGGDAHGGGKGSSRSIPFTDMNKIGQNLEKIASGEVKVTMTS